MPENHEDAVALHRWAVIAEAANPKLTPLERGRIVRAIASGTHVHPDGSERRYSRNTIDRWIRAWNKDRLGGLKPLKRSDCGVVRRLPELFDEAATLRLELPTRSAEAISDILWHRHGVRVAPRTLRANLRGRGLQRETLLAEPRVYGRYEAERVNERWVTDVLVDPWVPFPRVEHSIRARLFLVVDDKSRLLVHGRFMQVENTRAGQMVLRQAIVSRGLPEVLYCDNGAPFANANLARTCAVLGIRLVHSRPYSPEGRGKQERLNRYIRERFLAEACHRGIDNLDELNDRFLAWVTQVANRRVHAETNQSPEQRFEAAGPPRAAKPQLLADAFKWSVQRKVTRTATVSLDGNHYSVDPALVGRRVELRFEPEDLAGMEVFLEGKPYGVATPFIIGYHTQKHDPPTVPPPPPVTGVDYLGMVTAAHEAETVGSISFADAAEVNLQDTEEIDREQTN